MNQYIKYIKKNIMYGGDGDDLYFYIMINSNDYDQKPPINKDKYIKDIMKKYIRFDRKNFKNL